MKKGLISLAILLVVLVYLFYPEKVITYPAGITAPEHPTQTNINLPEEWTINEFNFKALAEYQIRARVLSRNDFSLGKESEISPLDLALGWGPLSDQSVIDKIEFSQSSRWYHWQADVLPISRSEISLNSANIHIIPKDEKIEKDFDNVYKGSLIEMQGYLVEVTTTDGWRWKSSLRRDDTGGGSCELFWVENLQVFEK